MNNRKIRQSYRIRRFDGVAIHTVYVGPNATCQGRPLILKLESGATCLSLHDRSIVSAAISLGTGASIDCGGFQQAQQVYRSLLSEEGVCCEEVVL